MSQPQVPNLEMEAGKGWLRMINHVSVANRIFTVTVRPKIDQNLVFRPQNGSKTPYLGPNRAYIGPIYAYDEYCSVILCHFRSRSLVTVTNAF